MDNDIDLDYTVHCRPSAITYTFAAIHMVNGVYQSEQYSIEKSDKGHSLILHCPKAGLLIPYGGQLIDESKKVRLFKQRNARLKDYIMAGLRQGTYWDAYPQSCDNCWPGAFVNEATEGMKNEKYNCRFVYLNRKYYPDVFKEYPWIVHSGELLFIEVMITSTAKKVEGLVLYNRTSQIPEIGNPRKQFYQAKLNHKGSYADTFGHHYSKEGRIGEKIMLSLEDEWEEQESLWLDYLNKKRQRETNARRAKGSTQQTRGLDKHNKKRQKETAARRAKDCTRQFGEKDSSEHHDNNQGTQETTDSPIDNYTAVESANWRILQKAKCSTDPGLSITVLSIQGTIMRLLLVLPLQILLLLLACLMIHLFLSNKW
jgi:hypothetical protein